jgi:hypothetical protein
VGQTIEIMKPNAHVKTAAGVINGRFIEFSFSLPVTAKNRVRFVKHARCRRLKICLQGCLFIYRETWLALSDFPQPDPRAFLVLIDEDDAGFLKSALNPQ